VLSVNEGVDVATAYASAAGPKVERVVGYVAIVAGIAALVVFTIAFIKLFSGG
jgi:hypothetical protein